LLQTVADETEEPLMDIEHGNVIISESTCGGSAIHTITAHHRGYPEIAVEAVSAMRAIEHLERLLLRALDYDAENWRREALQQAVADVRLYASILSARRDPFAGRVEQPPGSVSVRAD
jgi:hypothetical protein